jgi:pyruvate/2-oxoglutarate dehydrogenase complex dihydrolipoamide acyltransferase (E2) component
MQSTLNSKPADDPHDVLEVAPGVVLVAPGNAEEEVSSLLRAAARHHPYPKAREEPDFSAGAPIPPVDTTFRATATNNVKRNSGGGRVMRSFVGFLLAVGLGVAAAAWQAYGDTAQQMIAKVSPQRVLALLLPQDKPAQPAPPAADAATNAIPAQPSSPAEAAVERAAPTNVAASPAASPEVTPSLQSMARNLATAGQQIDQLKASIEQLKAGQEQMSRDIAKLSEAKAAETKASEKSAEPRARLSALPPRPVAAPPRRTISSYRPSQAAAPPMMPPAQYYVPRQVEPLPPPAMAQPPVDPELSSVPRPPMPMRE